MWDEFTVRGVIQQAHDILASGHHQKGALARDMNGLSVDVDSEHAVSFCEWGAVLAACHHFVSKEEVDTLANRANDVINAANPSAQYTGYKAHRENNTFHYNDKVLSTEQVVARLRNALLHFDDLADDLVTNVHPVKGATKQEIYVAYD